MARPEVTALVAKIREVTENAARLIKQGPQVVSMSDNTLKLGGKTYSQVVNDANTIINAHINNKNNPHGLVPSDAGMYDSQEIAALYEGRLPVGRAPIDAVGTQNYLPLGIGGSFEGATTSVAPRDAVLCVETDGTLVYLRNGSNGSKLGVYYAYLPDAETTGNLQPIKTNRRYRPAFIPAGMEVAYVFSGSDTVLLGRLQNSAGVQGDYFIALTNGTLDDSAHKGALITASAWNNFGFGEAFVVDDKVYLYAIDDAAWSGNTPLDIKVATIAVDSILTNQYVTLTPVTGFTVNGFNGSNLTGQSVIRLCPVKYSDNLADHPMIYLDAVGSEVNVSAFHFARPYFISAVGPGGIVRTRSISLSYFSDPVNGVSLSAYAVFSFTFNPVTKVVSLDPGVVEGGRLYRSGGSSLGLAGAMYAVSPATNGEVTSWNSFPSMTYYRNKVFNLRNRQAVDDLQLSRSTLTGYVSKYENLKVPSTVSGTGVLVTPIEPGFGSAIGGGLTSAAMVSVDKLMLLAAGRDKNGDYHKGYAYTQLEGSPDYAYASLNNTDYQGYRPSVNRGFVKDLPGVNGESDYTYSVNEITASAVRMTTCRFVSGVKLSGRTLINADFSLGGSTLSVTEAVIDSIKATAVSQATSQDSSPVVSTLVDLVIPQTLACPPFALAVTNQDNRRTALHLFAINIAGQSAGTITAVTTTHISSRVLLAAPAGLGIYHDTPLFTPPVVIYETPTAFLIGFSHGIRAQRIGSAPTGSFRFKYVKGSGQFVIASDWQLTEHSIGHTLYGYLATPALGFGWCLGPTVDTPKTNDDFTKLVFVPIAKTEAAFDSYTGVGGQRLVLASQDLPEGWIVYFTEETPLLLRGQLYTLPVSSLDLRTISANPVNKTFYIYVQVTAGTASWLISDQLLADNLSRIRIGRVTTGDLAIDEIVAEKEIRIAGARLSTVAAATAIPATAGNPAQPATHWN